MKNFLCPICNKNTSIVNKHHVIPKCYGGLENSLLLTLCENCHKAIHYTAEAEYRGKEAKYFSDATALQNAFPYIEAIKKAKDLYERTVDKEHLMKKVMLEITQKQLTQLHKRKASLGFSTTEKYLRFLIERDLKNL